MIYENSSSSLVSTLTRYIRRPREIRGGRQQVRAKSNFRPLVIPSKLLYDSRVRCRTSPLYYDHYVATTILPLPLASSTPYQLTFRLVTLSRRTEKPALLLERPISRRNRTRARTPIFRRIIQDSRGAVF